MIVVVDYGMGNLHSVAKAFEAIGGSVVISGKPEDLRRAERIVLPGVGAFADGIKNLGKAGLLEVLKDEAAKGKPLLGICLGMQMLAEEGSENGAHQGLGLIEGRVVALKPADAQLKIPHMGWNNIAPGAGSVSFFKGMSASPTFYFAHTYYMECAKPETVAATCDYGGVFTAAIQKGNIFATQFHPEKSQQNGLRLLRHFVSWKP